jgi:hypothetical protein
LGTAMKTWINVLGKFVIMNMHLVLREESLHRAHLSEEYDFIVGKGCCQISRAWHGPGPQVFGTGFSALGPAPALRFLWPAPEFWGPDFRPRPRFSGPCHPLQISLFRARSMLPASMQIP